MDVDVLILEKLVAANDNVSLDDLAQSLSHFPTEDLERALRKLLDDGYVLVSRHSRNHIHISSSGRDYLLTTKKTTKEVTKKRRSQQLHTCIAILALIVAIIGLIFGR